jgi:histidyl-tRNA synthetase
MDRCKGCFDLTPDEMRCFRFIEDVFLKTSKLWGYSEVRTPVLEYLHLFTSAGTLTPNMLKRVYSFLDWDGWSGERVVLRPEATIPVARYYSEKVESGKITRICYVTNVFSFEVDANQPRERWQSGVELIGDGGNQFDVELIGLGMEIINNLGLNNVSLKLSHAGIIKALLDQLDLNPIERDAAFDQILDGEKDVINRLCNGRPELVKVMSLFRETNGRSSAYLNNIKTLLRENTTQEFTEQLHSFSKTMELLDTQGIKYDIDLTYSRGFEYYTGIIFHFLVGETAVTGGGRYDALLSQMSGKSIPAAGFAFYIDRLNPLLKCSFNKLKNILFATNNLQNNETSKLVKKIRKAGYAVVVDIGKETDIKFDWQLGLAEKGGYHLIDLVNGINYQASNISAILKILAGEELEEYD